MNTIKRYRFFILTVIILSATILLNQEIGKKSFSIMMFSFKELILVVPPIFVLLGLLDVWVPREIMVKYMGEGSGIKGALLAFAAGSATAGPLYGAFPVAAVFMKKGVKFFNVLVFIGAWSTTKIPMFLFEISALGADFAFTRLFVNIPGIILIAYIICNTISQKDKEAIYSKAEKL